MTKYRIKQMGNKFYPQYKKLFIFHYYNGTPYMDYGPLSFLTAEKDYVFYNDLYFDSFGDANNFLINEKQSDINTYVYLNNNIICLTKKNK